MKWQDAEMMRKAGFSILQSKGYVERKTTPLSWVAVMIGVILYLLVFISSAGALTCEASYYTVASCLREGTSGICANGEALNDNLFTCASWDWKFGTVLLVKNVENGKTVTVVCNDRGPSKRLYRMGRKIDLSKAAMAQLGGIRKGIIQVTVTEVTK